MRKLIFMETKKKKSLVADRYSAVFRELGIAIALALVLMSFNLKSRAVFYHPEVIEEDTTVFFINAVPPTIEPPEKKVVEQQAQKSQAEVVKLIFTKKPVPEPTFDTSWLDLDVVIELPDFSMEKEIIDLPVLDTWQLSEVPSFPGGPDAFSNFLKENLEFPEMELRYGISGKVALQFTINKKGKVIDVQVIDGSTDNFKKEALRVGKMIPNWNPGKQSGVPVKCRFIVPINFQAG